MTAILPSDPAHCDHLISTKGKRAYRVTVPVSNLRLGTKEKLINICKSSPIEVCGFITAREEIRCVSNVHEEPRYNYFMEKESCREIINQIYEIDKSKILGIFHTHPNNQPWPSPRDIVGWPNLDLKWRYFIATKLELIEWDLVK